LEKYFYAEEISGDGLWETLKEFGSTVKHKLIPKPETKEETSYIKTLAYGRNDYPPKVRDILKEHGDSLITGMLLDRTPVQQLFIDILDKVSRGSFKERLKQTPYDKLFHLRLDITVKKGNSFTTLGLEKNEVINIVVNPTRNKHAETRTISNLPQNLTINKILMGAQKIQGDKFFKYSAVDNNCQDFIMAILNGSNIGNEEDRAFVKQSVSGLFDNKTAKFANFITTLGRKFNEFIYGTGVPGSSVVQSVVFDKPKYTTTKAIKWLKKHGYEGQEVDEKENTLRFRQINPDTLTDYEYRTHEITPDIKLIMAYKKTKPNKLYMSKKQDKVIRDLRKLEKEFRKLSSEGEIMGSGLFDAFMELGKVAQQGFQQQYVKPTMKATEVVKSIAEPAFEELKDYTVREKGGLRSDIVHKGIPLLVGEVLQKAVDYIPGLGMVVEGREEGRKLGKQLGDLIGDISGVGMKPIETVHIDIDSHNASSKGKNSMTGDGIDLSGILRTFAPIIAMKGGAMKKKRGKKSKKFKFSGPTNEAMEQLLEAQEEKAEKQLKKDLGQVLKQMKGGKLQKGSPEAKEWGRKMREARMKK
jgi:hypothetical protein